MPSSDDTHNDKHGHSTSDSQTASETVRAYLAALEARDLDAACSFLAKGFKMTFPGNVCFSDPTELVAWGRKRYRFVAKSYDGFDEMRHEDTTVVYCFGTLNGEWPDETPFSGIRFIDRFVVKGELLQDQRVWNDLAEN